MDLLTKIDLNNTPKHIAIIMDGNGRWAKKQGEMRLHGHNTGVESVRDLLVRTIAGEVNELHGSGVRMLAIGDIDGLPGDCNVELRQAMDKTKNNTDINLVLALNYSARSEMVNATKNIAEMVKNGEMTLDQIDDEVFSNHLTTKGIPDPELLIRTSGEYRISNFLLWQIAYSELHFTPVLWPDFKKEDLYKAVIDYQSRERRFGMVSEQISKSL